MQLPVFCIRALLAEYRDLWKVREATHPFARSCQGPTTTATLCTILHCEDAAWFTSWKRSGLATNKLRTQKAKPILIHPGTLDLPERCSTISMGANQLRGLLPACCRCCSVAKTDGSRALGFRQKTVDA